MNPKDRPFEFFNLSAALSGAVLLSMVNSFNILFSPDKPSTREIVKTGVETAFSLISAYISYLFVTPFLIEMWSITNLRVAGMLYLVLGIAFWKVSPLLINLFTSKDMLNAVLKALPFKFSMKENSDE